MPSGKVTPFSAKYQEIPEIGCWIWTACLSESGYGLVTINRRLLRAHRVSYEAKFGPIPEGLVIDHVCRQRSCVNPDHLRAVTHRENIMAEGSLSITKRQAERTHCTKCESELVDVYGKRRCLPCRSEKVKVYYDKQNKKRAEKKKAAKMALSQASS